MQGIGVNAGRTARGSRARPQNRPMDTAGGTSSSSCRLNEGPDRLKVSDAARVLLRYVELLTRHAWRTTAEDAQRLRDAGWTDEQIAEAVYVTAMFAFFNRVADAFGLVDPQYDTLGPSPPVASSPSALD